MGRSFGSTLTKTTFDAITNALMTTALTDESGAALGDALSLVERVEAVRGEIPGAPGDHQFRMYARRTSNAVETLERSRQFRHGADNSVFHKGYPLNYDSGDSDSDFAIDWDEIGDWYFRVSVFDQYDSRPPAALSKNDWGWSNSFGLKF